MSWALVVANVALVMVTVGYATFVRRQLRQSKQAMLTHKRYQVEGDITQLRIKRAEFLKETGGKTEQGKSPMDIINEREKDCNKTIRKIVQELESLRDKGKRNWVSDETLHWSEKTFHTTVLGIGALLLGVTLKSLWDMSHRDIQGGATIALVVVLMLLTVFGFFCISGRGVEIVEHLKDKIKKAESISLWGFNIRVPSLENEEERKEKQ